MKINIILTPYSEYATWWIKQVICQDWKQEETASKNKICLPAPLNLINRLAIFHLFSLKLKMLLPKTKIGPCNGLTSRTSRNLQVKAKDLYKAGNMSAQSQASDQTHSKRENKHISQNVKLLIETNLFFWLSQRNYESSAEDMITLVLGPCGEGGVKERQTLNFKPPFNLKLQIDWWWKWEKRSFFMVVPVAQKLEQHTFFCGM